MLGRKAVMVASRGIRKVDELKKDRGKPDHLNLVAPTLQSGKKLSVTE